MYIPDIVVTEVEPMLLDTNDKRVGPKKPEDNSSCHLYLLGVKLDSWYGQTSLSCIIFGNSWPGGRLSTELHRV